MGCDDELNIEIAINDKISTHTSLVGCDIDCDNSWDKDFEFLLTHPLWDVTNFSSFKLAMRRFLLTHPLWDVTTTLGWCETNHRFLLTHPLWDVTLLFSLDLEVLSISTHTSLVGCDLNTWQAET